VPARGDDWTRRILDILDRDLPGDRIPEYAAVLDEARAVVSREILLPESARGGRRRQTGAAVFAPYLAMSPSPTSKTRPSTIGVATSG